LTAPALADGVQIGLLTAPSIGSPPAAGLTASAEKTQVRAALTLATQQAQSVWSGPQRATTLTATRGADFDVLAHVKPLRIGGQRAIAHEKPDDFTGDLLASSLDDLDLQLIVRAL
jgi:hypothetical protein